MKFIFVQWNCCAANDMQRGNSSGYSQLQTVSFETAVPMPHAATPVPHTSGRSPRGGDRHGPNHTSLRVQCVDLSVLTSSILIGETDREQQQSLPEASGKIVRQEVV